MTGVGTVVGDGAVRKAMKTTARVKYLQMKCYRTVFVDIVVVGLCVVSDFFSLSSVSARCARSAVGSVYKQGSRGWIAR